MRPIQRHEVNPVPLAAPRQISLPKLPILINIVLLQLVRQQLLAIILLYGGP
jgi:hypothetical protein